MAYKRKKRSASRKAPKKPWKSYKKASLLRRALALGIKGAKSMKKTQLIWHLSRKCKRPGTKKRAKTCRRKVSKRKVVRRYKKRKSAGRKKKVIFSARGKTLEQLKKIAKRKGLKVGGKKATVAQRIRSAMKRRKR